MNTDSPEGTTMTDPKPMTCTFIPISNLQPGDQIVVGAVTGIRFSKSCLTVYVTYNQNRDGKSNWFKQSANTNIATF